MEINHEKIILIFALTVLMLNSTYSLAGSGIFIPPVFTYQSELLENNQPANGSYEFKVEINDTLGPLSSQEFIGVNAVTVTNGLFTILIQVPVGFQNAASPEIVISVRKESVNLTV